MTSAETRTWTPDRDKQLRELWERGLSSGQIAGRMGLTRNQVIGRKTRLKLPGRGQSVDTLNSRHIVEKVSRRGKASGHVTRLNARRREALCAQPVPKVDIEEIPDDLPDVTHLCGLLGLTEETCKWPVSGDGARMRFCGCPSEENSPYCEAHAKRAYDR